MSLPSLTGSGALIGQLQLRLPEVRSRVLDPAAQSMASRQKSLTWFSWQPLNIAL